MIDHINVASVAICKDKLYFLHNSRALIWKNPYQCMQCGFACNKKSSLLKYCKPNNCEITNVIHTGNKTYQYKHYSKYFLQRDNLKGHMRTHTGEKPYQCSQCEKCFSNNTSPKFHMKIHTGENRYQCNHCFNCFLQRHNSYWGVTLLM